ncbi:MAG: hypothetical protein ABI451_02265 [Dokdonella sp.]
MSGERRRAKTRRAFGSAVLLIAAGASMHSIAQTYSIAGHVISAGSTVRSRSVCYSLFSSIAEPVTGTTSSADFALTAGLRAATQAAPGDDLFFDSFEGCQP